MQLRKTQFHVSQMAQIARYDEICPASHCQFDQMVVSLVRQIRTPRIIYPRPFAAGKKQIKQFVAFARAQSTGFPRSHARTCPPFLSY